MEKKLSVEVGELVACRSAYSLRKVKVEKVTPTGRIKAGGRDFNPDGRERGADYGACYLSKLTPEIERLLHRRTVLKKIEGFDFGLLNTGELEGIYKIIGRKK